jgi:UDP-2,3-diacylglucosamine hydrolase
MTLPARAAALFVSDLHLQASHPATAAAFLRFLAQQAAAAQQLYLLGDLFEYWAGDDDIADPFHHSIVTALRAVADAGVAIFWIAGNRDFLVGPAFAEAAGLTLLREPHVVDIQGLRIVLLHGDAECTADTGYMAFRAMVREDAWQAQFLALPLAQRKAIIAGMRQDSRTQQSGKSYEIMDVAHDAVEQVFASTGASVMIHGHTHRPAVHRSATHVRYVLPDWELDEPGAAPGATRGGWIAVDTDGQIRRYDVHARLLD